MKNPSESLNVLKYLKILSGSPLTLNATPEIFTGVQSVRASRGGIFYPFVAEGAQVKESHALAQIKNIQGDVLETMHSPVQGLVGMFRPKRVKNSGDLAYVIWTST